jgi:hypothetical protein
MIMVSKDPKIIDIRQPKEIVVYVEWMRKREHVLGLTMVLHTIVAVADQICVRKLVGMVNNDDGWAELATVATLWWFCEVRSNSPSREKARTES